MARRTLVSTLPQFSGFEEEQPEAPENPDYTRWTAPMQLLTTALALAAAVLGNLNKSSIMSKVLIGLAVVVLLWVVGSFVFRWVRRYRVKSADISFATLHESELRNRTNCLRKFVDTRTSDSIKGILNDLNSVVNWDKLEGLTEECDCICSWADAFRLQLNYPSSTLDEFGARTREFTAVVSYLLRHIQRLQKELSKIQKPLPDSYIEKLETFREELNPFLRDLESWTVTVHSYLFPRLGWDRVPGVSFGRVKTFRPTQAIAVNGVLVNGV